MVAYIFETLSEEIQYAMLDENGPKYVVYPNDILPQVRLNLFAMMPRLSIIVRELTQDIKRLEEDQAEGVADICWMEDKNYQLTVTESEEESDDE